MEEIGHIEIRLKNFDNSLSPSDLDIAEIKEVISEVETFLFPTKTSKSGRPKISYQIEEGPRCLKSVTPKNTLRSNPAADV